jgi:hypothetical protein
VAPRIIGLSGYAQAGKDTMGRILVEEHGYTRIAFADILKAAIEKLNPYIPYAFDHDFPTDFARVRTLTSLYGRDETKARHPEYRRLLQVFGTEVGRQMLGEDVWVNAAFHQMKPDTKYVITDVRFPNEFNRIKNEGGEVWRVQRLDVGPANGHASETALDGAKFDLWLFNDAPIAQMAADIREILSGVRT